MSLNAVKYTEGRILVGGSISYPHGGERVTQQITDVPVALRRASVSASGLAPQQDTTCNLLFLDLDSLFLDLLGLQIDLSPVELSIDAMEGRDRLLGNLLCNLVRRD